MQTLREIKALLAERALAPNKRLGQNFLIDHNLLRRLVEASEVGEGDTVLEVGPGTGTLTDALLDAGCRIVACELDRGLAELLRDRFADRENQFTLIEGDCLQGKHALNPQIGEALDGSAFTLVANLPYGAATPLILTLLTKHPQCARMCVTIQLEVAQRLAASTGSAAYGEISVLTNLLASVRHIADLPPECFWPRPQVRSAMIRIDRRQDSPTGDPEALESVCRRLFGQRRKQIGAILGRSRPFPEGIDPTSRAENLSPQQFLTLAAWTAEPGPENSR